MSTTLRILVAALFAGIALASPAGASQWANMPNRTFECYFPGLAHPETISVLPNNNPPIFSLTGKNDLGNTVVTIDPLIALPLTSTNAKGKPDWTVAVAPENEEEDLAKIGFQWLMVKSIDEDGMGVWSFVSKDGLGERHVFAACRMESEVWR